jgi:hypothetical protein
LVVATSGIEEVPQRFFAEPGGACAELACKRVKRGERPGALDRLSDHCPVVVELLAQDRDG